VGLISAVLAFVTVVQLRSQAEVQASLAGQNNTALAFLIDDLHRTHDRLSAETQVLSQRLQALQAGNAQAAISALQLEQRQLDIIDGLVPVSGPGVVLTVDAPLTAVDVQDALNNIRLAGAEAIMVDGQRVITGSVVVDAAGGVVIDGVAEGSPWTFTAIGDPTQLTTAAELMARSLQSDPRVIAVSYRTATTVKIPAVLKPRPLVYGTP